MSSIKNRTADALAPTLSNFHEVNDQQLKGVQYIYRDGSLESVVLEFDKCFQALAADENDDTIDLSVVRTNLHDVQSISGNHLDVWEKFIGKRFGWGWVTVNQQGYCDGVLLSFEGIVPQIAVSVVASSIKIAMILAFA